jgi:hypothetical protein
LTDLKPITILFNAGQTDAVAAKLLPNGLFERVVNGRYRKDGALEVRQGFTPLDMSTYSGTLQAFDLYSYGETLVALGSDVEAFPTDLYVFNNQVAAVPWRGLGTPETRGLDFGSEVTLVGGLPFTGGNIFGLTLAATNGMVAASCSGLNTIGATRTLHIFKPDTDATVLLERDELTAAGGASWAVALGNDFGWVRQNPVTGVVTLVVADVTGPGAPALGGATTLFSDSDPLVQIAVKTDATRIHVLYRVASSNNVQYRQFTHAGVQNGTGKVVFSASATTRFAMSVTATQVHTLVKVTSTGLSLLTFGIASPFTTAVGPTAIVTAAQDATIADSVELLALTGASEIRVFYTTTVASNTTIVAEQRSITTHALSSTKSLANFALKGGAEFVGGEVLLLASHLSWEGATTDLGLGATALVRMGFDGSFAFAVMYYEDRQIMRNDSGSGGNRCFNIAFQGSTAYVGSGYNTSVSSMQANIRRVQVESTARRPGVELGGLLYLAGGQVQVTDGRQLVESGMPPAHIDGTTSQGTDGALTQGGLYKYRGHYEWYDWKGYKHLSPVSREVEVQLTGANDAVTLTTQVPPSLRAYPPGEAASSAPQFKLFRTETNLNPVPAELVIAPTTAQLSSISAGGLNSLETLSVNNSLRLNVNGAGEVVINFAATDTNLVAVGAAIVAQTVGLRAAVDDTGTILTLSTILEGIGASIVVGTTLPGLCAILLGLALGQTSTGSQEAEAGELFFLTATLQLDVSAASTTYAEFLTITDRTADADLIDNETIYTTGDRGAVSGVLDFAPPLPASFIAATRDRIVCAGSNEVVQISQRAFPNEAVAFVDVNLVGTVGFAYQARVEGRITGIAAIDDTIVVGTRDELFVIGGEGPNYVGLGEFTPPARLPSETGIYDNRATVLCSEGLWFQGDLDKLYLIPRGGGAPTFEGKPAQDRLGTGISGAASTEGDVPVVVFAVENVARLIVRDLVSKQWFEDSIPEPAARSLIEHQGLFYFVDDDGDVWGQGGFTDNGAAVVLTVTTGTLAPFGLNGWGRLAGIVTLGERLSDATLQVEISYDEGVNYTTLGTQTITGLTTGAPVRAEFVPAIQRGDRYKLRFTMTPTDGGAGIALNGFTLYVRASDSGPPRLESGRRFS